MADLPGLRANTGEYPATGGGAHRCLLEPMVSLIGMPLIFTIDNFRIGSLCLNVLALTLKDNTTLSQMMNNFRFMGGNTNIRLFCIEFYQLGFYYSKT